MRCNPDVLNITLRRFCQAGFGPRVMDNAHIFQLHYKTAWVHDERPNFYKSIYVVLKMLDKEPPLAQMWVETRWEYLQSINILNGTLSIANGTLSMIPLVGSCTGYKTTCVRLTSQRYGKIF